MKSLTFFSLGAAHASQVYTKTVNSGFFRALLTRFLNHTFLIKAKHISHILFVDDRVAP